MSEDSNIEPEDQPETELEDQSFPEPPETEPNLVDLPNVVTDELGAIGLDHDDPEPGVNLDPELGIEGDAEPLPKGDAKAEEPTLVNDHDEVK